jgi:hypothetical protein
MYTRTKTTLVTFAVIAALTITGALVIELFSSTLASAQRYPKIDSSRNMNAGSRSNMTSTAVSNITSYGNTTK